MSKTQSLVELYKGIFAALIAQGKTTMSRPDVFHMRQVIWPTWKGNGIADIAPLSEAASQLGLKELFDVGPKGKRSNVRFVV